MISYRNTTPDISIIMPVWNGLDFIEQALSSIYTQELKLPYKAELIVVEDGNKSDIIDATLSKLNDWKRKFNVLDWIGMDYISLTRNEGVSIARNCGIKASSGKYICYLDCDDIMGYKRLEFALETITKYSPDADILLSPYILKDLETGKSGKWDFTKIRGKELEYINYMNISASIGLIHSKEIYNKCVAKFRHGFVPGLYKNEDWVLWRRMLEFNPKILYNNKIAGTHFIHENCQSKILRPPESKRGFVFTDTNGKMLDSMKDFSNLMEKMPGFSLTKVCTMCKIEKPLEKFATDNNKRDKKRVYCKECGAQKERERQERIKKYGYNKK